MLVAEAESYRQAFPGLPRLVQFRAARRSAAATAAALEAMEAGALDWSAVDEAGRDIARLIDGEARDTGMRAGAATEDDEVGGVSFEIELDREASDELLDPTRFSVPEGPYAEEAAAEETPRAEEGAAEETRSAEEGGQSGGHATA